MTMEAQAINGMKGTNGTINPRGDFSDREKEFIIQHAGMPGWSWGSIARALGKQFPEDNGGKRTREGVRIFATRDPDRPVNIQVPIQASLIEAARKKGIEVGAVVAKALMVEVGTVIAIDGSQVTVRMDQDGRVAKAQVVLQPERKKTGKKKVTTK